MCYLNDSVLLKILPYKTVVKTDSLNGITRSFRDSAIRTWRSANKLWLIEIPSERAIPSFPVRFILSEPPRSTRFNLEICEVKL